MFLNAGKLAVIKPGAPQASIVEIEPQRMHQVQGTACIGTKAYDVAGVGRYFRLIQYDVKQWLAFRND